MKTWFFISTCSKEKLGAKKEIGIHAIRAGDIVREHTILFGGLGEAIKYLYEVDKDNAKVFSTQEVL